jgi:diguanylate cyclase (GGDEF)-like protein
MSFVPEHANLPTKPASINGLHLALWIAKGLTAAATFGFTLWAATHLLMRTHTEVSAALASLMVTLGVLMIAGAFAREVFAWRRPVAALAKQLSALSDGDLPMGSLDDLPPHLRPLRGPLLELLQTKRALAIETKRLEAETRQRVHNRTDALERKLGALEVKANRDALTQCFNRRAMDEQLPRIVDGCRGRQADCVLLMIDVDYFKQLNDTLGHAAGDDCLRSIGQIIRSSLRTTDFPFRYGGDEFAIVLPGGDLGGARLLAERLRHLVDGLTKQYRNLKQRPQLSIGISALSELDVVACAPALLAKADERLYAIKHARKVQRVA